MNKRRLKVVIIFTIIFSTWSCSEIKTTDADTTFKYWSGTSPADDLNILKGQYWQSGHWSSEYIMFLKLKPSGKWWYEFKEQNQISVDQTDWTLPNDAPTWFVPSENSVRFIKNQEIDQGSRYLRDTLTGTIYIYEIQL